MFISKTRESAKVFSREAGAISFDQTNISKTTVGGTDPIGSASIEQLEMGVIFPNTQSAIADIAENYQHQINEVVTLMEVDGVMTIPPEGVNMVMRLTIDGIVEEDGVIHVFGLPIRVTKDQNKAAFTDALIAELNKYKDLKIAFREVSKLSGSDSKVDVKFIDTLSHSLISVDSNGITITSEVSTHAKSGYGKWEYIGESVVDTPAVSGKSIKLKYYRRLS